MKRQEKIVKRAQSWYDHFEVALCRGRVEVEAHDGCERQTINIDVKSVPALIEVLQKIERAS